VSPCYALSHNYSYFAVDGKGKQVSRYILGNVNDCPLVEIWTSEEYVLFRSEYVLFASRRALIVTYARAATYESETKAVGAGIRPAQTACGAGHHPLP